MKKSTQILLSLLIVMKISLGSILLYQSGLPFFEESKALASDQKKVIETIKMIENESLSFGLTNKIEELLKKEHRGQFIALQGEYKSRIRALAQEKEELQR